MWLVHMDIKEMEEKENKKMAQKKFKMSGMLKAVEITDGKKQDGTEWQRSSLKIESSDGKTRNVSTFDTNDTKTANEANGKEVEVVYTKSSDGKYNNLESGTIKVIGQGEAPVTDEEEIEEEGSDKIKEEADEKYNVKPTDQPQKKMYSEDYWRAKFEFEKITHYERQTSIVRQNSWTQAMKYLESCLRAVEQGLIAKKDFTTTEMTIDKMKEIAHQIETDIMRKNGTK